MSVFGFCEGCEKSLYLKIAIEKSYQCEVIRRVRVLLDSGFHGRSEVSRFLCRLWCGGSVGLVGFSKFSVGFGILSQ